MLSVHEEDCRQATQTCRSRAIASLRSNPSCAYLPAIYTACSQSLRPNPEAWQRQRHRTRPRAPAPDMCPCAILKQSCCRARAIQPPSCPQDAVCLSIKRVAVLTFTLGTRVNHQSCARELPPTLVQCTTHIPSHPNPYLIPSHPISLR